MTETLVRVSAPHFVAGLIVTGGQCTHAAPILGWAIGRDVDYLRKYFAGKGWSATASSISTITSQE